MGKTLRTGLVALIGLTTAIASAGPAVADPAQGGEASAFAATATVAGNALIPPTPVATVTAPPAGDDEQTSIPLDVDPVAINGTLIATAAVHEDADLASALEQPAAAQSVAGPYNARAVGQVEDVEVLVDTVAAGVPLVEADAVRGEAVAVCAGDAVTYGASSEVVNLVVGGQDPLSGPLNDLVTQISEALNASPLVDLVDIDVNVVTQTATGASVDALVVSVLPVVDPASPLVQVRLGHAEVAGVDCGPGAPAPACSDTEDNDGDGVIDAADPGCHTDGDPTNPDSYDPADDDEADPAGPACSDTEDNDGDGVIDAADPGCHSDGDPTNPDSYDPADDDEADPARPLTAVPTAVGEGPRSLPVTGVSVPTAAASGLGALALAGLALRRRATV